MFSTASTDPTSLRRQSSGTLRSSAGSLTFNDAAPHIFRPTVHGKLALTVAGNFDEGCQWSDTCRRYGISRFISGVIYQCPESGVKARRSGVFTENESSSSLFDSSSSLFLISACTHENRSMEQIIRAQPPGGFLRRRSRRAHVLRCRDLGVHPCLDSIGKSLSGDAVCHKYDSDDGGWELWGPQSEQGMACRSN